MLELGDINQSLWSSLQQHAAPATGPLKVHVWIIHFVKYRWKTFSFQHLPSSVRVPLSSYLVGISVVTTSAPAVMHLTVGNCLQDCKKKNCQILLSSYLCAEFFAWTSRLRSMWPHQHTCERCVPVCCLLHTPMHGPPGGTGPLTTAAVTQDIGLRVKEKIDLKMRRVFLPFLSLQAYCDRVALSVL